MADDEKMIGHNGPPPDKAEAKFTPKVKLGRIVEILDRDDLTATQKCVGIALVATSDQTGSCTLGRTDLARMASAKDKTTIFAATERLENDLVEKIKTPGKANTYRIIPKHVVDGVMEALNDLKTSRIASTQSGTQEPASSNPPGGSNPTSSNPPGGPELGSLDQPGRSKLGGFDPTSGVQSPQSSRTRIDITSSTVEDIDKEEDIRKGGVGENLPFDDLPTAEPKPKRGKPRAKPTVDQFERFWDAYPLRKGKPKAQERFMALTPDHAEQAIAGAIAFARECAEKHTEAGFIKWPQGWLSERRFVDFSGPERVDDLVGPNGKRWGWWRGIEEKLRGLSIEYWREGIAKAKPNGTWPWWLLTAPPGHEDCLVPMELQEPLIEVYKGKIHHA